MWLLLALGCAAVNVFVVPHSHIDTGWVWTIDQYYTQHASYIISNMFTLLSEDPLRKFVWSESVFIQRYLTENPQKIPIMKQYIAEGRIGIAGGGWEMSDEALVDFEGHARQMEAGHNFYREVLGVTDIKIGWQLDPFGHTSVTQAIFEDLGFDFAVINRIDEDFRVLYK